MTIQLQNETPKRDGIIHFVEGRYVGASEAAWRILRFRYVDRPPLVVILDVTLEHYCRLYY